MQDTRSRVSAGETVEVVVTVRSGVIVFGMVCRWSLGGILLYAGLCKIDHVLPLLQVVYGYEIIAPPYGRVAAQFLPIAELVVGGALVARIGIGGASVCGALLMSCFVVAQASVIVRAISVSCGCFGDDIPVGYATLARTFTLAALAWTVFGIWFWTRYRGWEDVPVEVRPSR